MNEYTVTYRDHEGSLRTVAGIYAKDAFTARCVCVELVGSNHITKVLPPRIVPQFDF